MIDCPNAEMRDQLPDLVSGTLSEPARSVVQSHVDVCAECRAEVALLRGIRRRIIADTPTVAMAPIHAAVAAIRPSGVTSIAAQAGDARVAHRSRMDWRIAATVLFMAIGGGTMMLVQANHHARYLADSAIAADSQTTAATAATPELGMPGTLDDLSTEQLQTLIDKIHHMDALPPLSPDQGDVDVGGSSVPDGSSDAGDSGVRGL